MGGPQHVLIVDDKPANLVALELVLRATGAKVTSAASGNEALAATLRQDFALAILDVQMPEMDGYELAELLRSEKATRHLPIIFMSAVYSDDYHVFRGYEAGAVDFLTKPYRPEILLNKVRFFLLLDQQRQELVGKLEAERSRNYLESILTCMTESVVVVSVEHEIRLANRATIELLGYEEDELIGAPLERLFGETSSRQELSSLIDAPSAESIRTQEAFLLSKGGDRVPVLLSASVLHDDSKRRAGIIIAAIDNTERKRAEVARDALESQLRHSQRLESVGRLAGGIAHDFNNLLTVILSYASFVTEELPVSNPLSADMGQIIEASERAGDLVGQLLALSHKQVLQPEVLSINEVVSTATQMFERLLGEDIELQVQLGEQQPYAFVDPGQLSQVLLNLAINARDAMPQGGALFISTECRVVGVGAEAQQVARITVRDVGLGIGPGDMDQIFEPFFTTKEVGRGTGLGLSVVHGIITQSGGEINVTSVPGEGTTFIIDLPYLERENPRPQEDERSQHQSDTAATILVVEDDDQVRQVAQRILQEHGYRVLETHSPKEALLLVAGDPEIALLLSDVVMPETSGPELARLLHEDTPELPVLFMSGHAHDALERYGMSGSAPLLQKPFTPRSLLARVHEMLVGK